MKPTRQHILDHALKLFNSKGLVNVRLQHIADAAFVSVGHLAYHFKNKDALVAALYEDITTRQEQLLNEYKVVPLFEDVNRYLSDLWQLQSKYIFFFLDKVEVFRAYPGILEKHRQHTQWQQLQIILLLEFNLSRGAITLPGLVTTTQLANYFRLHTDNWRYMMCTEGKAHETETGFKESAWGLLMPYFTDMGMREYRQMLQGLNNSI